MFSLEMKRLRRTLSMCMVLGEARHFSVMPRKGTRGSGKLHLNIMKRIFFFTVRVIEHWSMLPREVAQSPSSEIFKTPRDTALNSS